VLNNVQGYLWRWSVERVAPNQDYIRLRYGNRDLRANGRLRRWNTFVTVARNRRRRLTTMMQWTVHVVPASPVPLPLLEAPPQPQVRGFAIPLHCIGMELTSASFTWNTAIQLGTPQSWIAVLLLACLPKKIGLLHRNLCVCPCLILKLFISSDTKLLNLLILPDRF
jgi:hypothetical protein